MTWEIRVVVACEERLDWLGGAGVGVDSRIKSVGAKPYLLQPRSKQCLKVVPLAQERESAMAISCCTWRFNGGSI